MPVCLVDKRFVVLTWNMCTTDSHLYHSLSLESLVPGASIFSSKANSIMNPSPYHGHFIVSSPSNALLLHVHVFVSCFIRDNPDIVAAVSKLHSFHVTQFMIDKMKSFMRSVQGLSD